MFRRDKSTNIIYNGVRTARMRLNLVIPPSMCIAGELVCVWYPTQLKMCRRCGDSGHIVAKCTSVRCFNCEVPGHCAEECPSVTHCSICLSLDRAVLACPFLLYSANVVDQPEDVPEAISPPVPSPSYAKAAGLGSKQPSESQPSASQSSSSSKQVPKHFSKKAASEPLPSVPPSPEKHAEREHEHSRERHSGRDRDRDRERASARDDDRPHDRHRDHSREGELDRSGRRHHHHNHHHDSRSSAEESDGDFIEVRSKRRSRR